MGSSKKWLKIIGSIKEMSNTNNEGLSATGKSNRWKLWKSFRFIGKKFTHAEREAGVGSGKNVMIREERAAICIQTEFRGFLARKALRALKGLARLQAAITGHDNCKQSSVSLHCIQAFVRVQARVHKQRAGERRDGLGLLQQDVPTLIVENCTADSEMEWCNTLGTVEDIQAKEQQRRVAAIKRERAIAYAFCNKWKGNTKINPGSLFDYELDNSTWIWMWLDEWLNGQPKKAPTMHGNSKQKVHKKKQTDGAGKRVILENTTTVGIQQYTSTKSSPDGSNERKRVLTRVGSPGRFRLVRSMSGGKGRRIKALSPKPDANLQSRKSSGKMKQQPSKNVKQKASLK